MDRQRREEEALSKRAMHQLTGGLTTEGDTFLIAVGAVLLMIILYPLVGVWSMLAFPVAVIAAVVGRAALRRRKATTRIRDARSG